MIVLRALFLALFLPFFFGTSHSSGEETVIVNKEFNGREIKVRAGGVIRVDLEELGSAGYAWAIQDLDGEVFEVLNVKAEGALAPGDTTGKPVLKTWNIRAKKPGKGELKFLHYRPWEGKEKAGASFVLKVRVL